jgi:polysaccharide biosynthesis/export protein
MVIEGSGTPGAPLSRIARIACCALAAVVVAGCGAAGPTGRDLLSAAKEANPEFVMVDLSEPSLDIVASWHKPSFNSLYGDYRSPTVQRVDIGDMVQINIWETGGGSLFAASTIERANPGSRAALIPEQVVARDGTINVPYAGRIRVAGRTPAEIEKQIIDRLAGKTADPQAMVTLTRNLTHTATVTGDVTTGARVPLSPKGDRILDVVASAGGIKAPVHEAFITLSREGKSLSVPLQAILSNTRENIYIRPGDVITVYRAPQSFTAFGATGRNAVIGFDAGGISLDEALGKAGGLNDDRSDPYGVFVLRYEPAALAQKYPNVPQKFLARGVVPVAYRLNMRDPTSLFRARRFSMRDKDILYVSHAPITEVEKIFRLFQMLTAPAVTAATIHAVTN